MNLFKTTQEHNKYWQERKIDWKTAYASTYNHPHRKVLADKLSEFHWISLIEIGCGAGANLIYFTQRFKGRQLGGIDISQDAIDTANKIFKNAMLRVGDGLDIMMSDKSADVCLTDMYLIYVGRFKILKQLKELKRVARNQIVLCEFHSESWWDRFKLKFNSGYNAYDYRKLLQKVGFYDIMLYKLTEEDWPGGNPQKKFAYIITAKIPRL